MPNPERQPEKVLTVSCRPDLNNEQPVALVCGGLFLFEYQCIAVRVQGGQDGSSGRSFLAERCPDWYNVLSSHKVSSSNPVATFAANERCQWRYMADRVPTRRWIKTAMLAWPAPQPAALSVVGAYNRTPRRFH